MRGDWRTAHFGQFLGRPRGVPRPARAPTRRSIRRGRCCAGTVRPAPDADLPLIDDPLTARVADLFDVINEIVIQLLARYFAATDETPAQRESLADAAVGLMFAASSRSASG